VYERGKKIKKIIIIKKDQEREMTNFLMIWWEYSFYSPTMVSTVYSPNFFIFFYSNKAIENNFCVISLNWFTKIVKILIRMLAML
jgi:hypothetical protein